MFLKPEIEKINVIILVAPTGLSTPLTGIAIPFAVDLPSRPRPSPVEVEVPESKVPPFVPPG
jgi:hypothetical protein